MCHFILQQHNPDEKYWVLFAASHVFNKVFFVDTRDASVLIWTVDRVCVMQAVPDNGETGVAVSLSSIENCSKPRFEHKPRATENELS